LGVLQDLIREKLKNAARHGSVWLVILLSPAISSIGRAHRDQESDAFPAVCKTHNHDFPRQPCFQPSIQLAEGEKVVVYRERERRADKTIVAISDLYTPFWFADVLPDFEQVLTKSREAEAPLKQYPVDTT
jgi:hypothetical protein